MVVTVGHNQPILGIELEAVWRPELARPRARPANEAKELSSPVEHRDAADEIGRRHVGVTLSDIDITVPGVGHDVRRVGESLGRIASHSRLSQRHQDLALGAELHDHASLAALSRELGESSGLGARASVTHTLPSQSTWMPCGHTNMPPPKLLISFPD